MGTYAGALKIAGLRARPAVAVTIDTDEDPPTILQLRGLARVTDVEGVVPEYIAAMRRFRGDAQAEAVLAEIDKPGLRMARIAITPTWAGLIDFRQRFPQALTRGAWHGDDRRRTPEPLLSGIASRSRHLSPEHRTGAQPCPHPASASY